MQRVLIANRGEIALRILRACRLLGKQAVAVYTRADEQAPIRFLADDAVCIGARSYLQPDNILMAAKLTDCDSVHPGYGLLSENASFARQVEAEHLCFIGPTPDHLDQFGNKRVARDLFAELGLAGIPGSAVAPEDELALLKACRELGYPVVIKAAFGGGGRGIRVVHNDSEARAAHATARAEAHNSFGEAELYVERLIPRARHVEVQVAGDGMGHAVHLFTRDCSLQRRFQKLVEEAPAPGIDQGTLNDLCKSATAAVAKLNYRSLATLEFLYDGTDFWFLEINPRLQVEHPVTEGITGMDLVALQLQVAELGVLPFDQQVPAVTGHALECRVIAEDANFQPSPGQMTTCVFPGGPGVRVDSHVFAGYRVPHEYDSLLAKVIVHADNRALCILRMKQALTEMDIQGVSTNLPQLLQWINDPDFHNLAHHTAWLDGGDSGSGQ